MTLYLYKIGSSAPVLTIENVQGYTADSVTAKTRKEIPSSTLRFRQTAN